MSDNITKLYSEAIGDVVEDIFKNGTAKEEELKQKNIEAWAQWQQIPQTHIFMKKLMDTRAKLSVHVSQTARVNPDTKPDWIQSRLVEISLLDELVMRTCQDGSLME